MAAAPEPMVPASAAGAPFDPAAAAAIDRLAHPPTDPGDRLELLEAVEAELRERLGRLDPR